MATQGDMVDIDLLAAVPPEVRQELTSLMTSRSFALREHLWAGGDPADVVCFVTEGWVKLVIHEPGGREVVVQLSGPGSMLCTSAVGGAGAYCCSAVAATSRTRISMLPRERLVELMSRNPSVLRALLQALGCRAREGCSRIVDIGGARVEQRIARVLERLVEQAGVVETDGATRIPLALTPKDLADLCATTVETATSVMRQLEETGAVTPDSDEFIVRDPEALSHVARLDAP